MPSSKNVRITLASRPVGFPKVSDFNVEEVPISEPAEGEILIKASWLSLDPYMRARLDEAKGYAEPIQIGEVIIGAIVGEVIETRTPRFKIGDIIEGSLDLDNDAQVEDYWWDESEEDDRNSVYFEELEEIEVSFQAIDAYLTLKNIQDNDIYYDHQIPFDTLTTIWSWNGLLVECDSFGMEKWWDNWMWEGVEPGEADFYENWYVIFNIVSDLDIYLPIILENCDYNESDNVMMCGGQEIKIGYEYIIKNISTLPGERGNGIIFVTEDIEEW